MFSPISQLIAASPHFPSERSLRRCTFHHRPAWTVPESPATPPPSQNPKPASPAGRRMDLSTHESGLHISHEEQPGTSRVSSPSQMITPTKSNSRGLLSDLTGWPSYSEMYIQAPGSQDNARLHQRGNCAGGTPSGMAYARGAFQKTTHLPTPQSPGNMASYLFTRTPSSAQELQTNIDLSVLPTEFRSHTSPSPPPFRPHLIPTPESSPLVTRSRNNNGAHVLAQIARVENGLRSRASTPPRTPSRQSSTRPVTPVSHSRPTTPIQRRPTENLHSSNSTNALSQSVKDESAGGEVADIPARLIENYLASTQTAESHRPHSLKRARRSTPTSNSGTGGASLTSDLGGKDTSLLWSSGIIDSPAKGKRTALFQETSEESFEECLMAGGYERYRSDRASWKLDEDEDSPNQLGDAIGEDGPSSGMVLTEEEKRKKDRLAAFLDPPRSSPSATRLFPVEIEGRGRVLMKVEFPEPQTAPKPTPKTKRSRKRKKLSADMKQDVESIAAPEDRTIDGPNWPDAEFPWRSYPMAQDGLSSAEREERLRYIESFLDRDSDEDDVEERRSSSSRTDEVSQSGGGKMYPLLTHSKVRRRGSTMLSVVSSDPADAKTALLSKRSTRAVQLRLLRRRDVDRSASDDGEALCICRGWDDGRPLVQCDACQTWYHLECIGIQSPSDLGREEDPWFCANCVEVKTPPPVVARLSEPTFVPSDDGEHGVGGRSSADPEGYNPPFLNAGLNPSPATPWTRSAGPPMTPPRMQNATQVSSGTSWEEAPSSSSRGGPRTPQFDSTSAFGDVVRVYGMAPVRSLEPSSSTTADDSPFDPTSTPSRGIRFGLPFATPKDGRWEASSWQGGRGSVHELLHTPKHPPEDVSSRSGQPLHYHGRVEEFSHELSSRTQGLYRAGTNNVTPIERDGTVGPRWMQGLESPLGAKRPRRTIDS